MLSFFVKEALLLYEEREIASYCIYVVLVRRLVRRSRSYGLTLSVTCFPRSSVDPRGSQPWQQNESTAAASLSSTALKQQRKAAYEALSAPLEKMSVKQIVEFRNQQTVLTVSEIFLSLYWIHLLKVPFQLILVAPDCR